MSGNGVCGRTFAAPCGLAHSLLRSGEHCQSLPAVPHPVRVTSVNRGRCGVAVTALRANLTQYVSPTNIVWPSRSSRVSRLVSRALMPPCHHLVITVAVQYLMAFLRRHYAQAVVPAKLECICFCKVGMSHSQGLGLIAMSKSDRLYLGHSMALVSNH